MTASLEVARMLQKSSLLALYYRKGRKETPNYENVNQKGAGLEFRSQGYRSARRVWPFSSEGVRGLTSLYKPFKCGFESLKL